MNDPTTPEIQPAPSAAAPLQIGLVIREDAQAWLIERRDRQGRPMMKPFHPKLRLTRGTRLRLDPTHQESSQDAGDGLVHAQDGLYLFILAGLDGPLDSRIAGAFIPLQSITNFEAGRWVMTIIRTNPQVLKGRDAKGKPFFEPTPLAGRIKVQDGERLRVSTIHTESEKDPGDGTILSSGLQPYLLILECPSVPQAAGLFVEKEAVADLPPA